ncbi:MAG: hypothetical protein PHV30_12070 [Candidatus Margulisbacteria bacterium]|nr:hypothetical protein [Candidatus Margulisiibacteriota bacterium]
MTNFKILAVKNTNAIELMLDSRKNLEAGINIFSMDDAEDRLKSILENASTFKELIEFFVGLTFKDQKIDLTFLNHEKKPDLTTRDDRINNAKISIYICLQSLYKNGDFQRILNKLKENFQLFGFISADINDSNIFVSSKFRQLSDNLNIFKESDTKVFLRLLLEQGKSDRAFRQYLYEKCYELNQNTALSFLNKPKTPSQILDELPVDFRVQTVTEAQEELAKLETDTWYIINNMKPDNLIWSLNELAINFEKLEFADILNDEPQTPVFNNIKIAELGTVFSPTVDITKLDRKFTEKYFNRNGRNRGIVDAAMYYSNRFIQDLNNLAGNLELAEKLGLTTEELKCYFRGKQFLLYDGPYCGSAAEVISNEDENTILIFGPFFRNHKHVTSSGPIIMLHSKPMSEIISDQWVFFQEVEMSYSIKAKHLITENSTIKPVLILDEEKQRLDQKAAAYIEGIISNGYLDKQPIGIYRVDPDKYELLPVPDDDIEMSDHRHYIVKGDLNLESYISGKYIYVNGDINVQQGDVDDNSILISTGNINIAGLCENSKLTGKEIRIISHVNGALTEINAGYLKVDSYIDYPVKVMADKVDCAKIRCDIKLNQPEISSREENDTAEQTPSGFGAFFRRLLNWS